MIDLQNMSTARFDPVEADHRSKLLFGSHDLVDPRFAPVGSCSRKTRCSGVRRSRTNKLVVYP